MNLSHPFRISFCQVVIDGNDVNAFSFQRIQVRRECRYQGLSFTGLHLGNSSLMENDSAHELYPVMFHMDGTVCGFSYNGKGLHQQIIQCLAIGQPLFKLDGFSTKFFIGQRLHLFIQCFNGIYQFGNSFYFSFTFVSKKYICKTHNFLLYGMLQLRLYEIAYGLYCSIDSNAFQAMKSLNILSLYQSLPFFMQFFPGGVAWNFRWGAAALSRGERPAFFFSRPARGVWRLSTARIPH